MLNNRVGRNIEIEAFYYVFGRNRGGVSESGLVLEPNGQRGVSAIPHGGCPQFHTGGVRNSTRGSFWTSPRATTEVGRVWSDGIRFEHGSGFPEIPTRVQGWLAGREVSQTLVAHLPVTHEGEKDGVFETGELAGW